MANIFEKIQSVRVELAKKKLSMTGQNKHVGYKYYELEDFLPALNELMAEHKMTAIPSFNGELATLTAINLEQVSERYEITSPMGTAKLSGCHEVQNIGAVETYQRRYLYQAMFDIAESDAADGSQGKPHSGGEDAPAAKKRQDAGGGNTKSKYAQISELIKGTEYTMDNVNEFITQTNKGSQIKINDLTDEQFEYIYAQIKKSIEKMSK